MSFCRLIEANDLPFVKPGNKIHSYPKKIYFIDMPFLIRILNINYKMFEKPGGLEKTAAAVNP